MKRTLTLVSALALMLSMLALPAASETGNDLGEPTYTEEWEGQGTDSEKCELADGELRDGEEGWIHWIFSTKGESTDARLTLGGSGSGTYDPGPPLDANTWHFYTPYFDIFDEDGIRILTATIDLFGGDRGPGNGLVISDYCPGVDDAEELTVNKTADTSFTREHFWDIDKKVETENDELVNGTPKVWLYTDGSGDETATWTVDVTYEDFLDRDFNVSGKITIENTGNVDAVITAVADVLADDPIDVDCGVEFPYTLPASRTLTCTYDEDVDGQIEGFNVVTVTTERDEYKAEAEIVWGDPTTEKNETVNVKDISDLFGEVDLGSVTAPDGDTFTYDKNFAWEDYGQDGCGSEAYDNTATIVETGQSAKATLKVNVQCYEYESAWAKANTADVGVEEVVSFCDAGFNNWGWTNQIDPGTHKMDLWAGAGQCDTSKGTLVGDVTVTYDGDGNVTAQFNVADEYLLDDSTAFYAGEEQFPTTPRGAPTTAPGQYTNEGPFESEPIWTIAHANVGIPDPDFGPAE